MYKILVIGDQATGKTSMVNRFVNKTFDPVHRATIACDFSLKIVQINGRPLRIQLWDIAGTLRCYIQARTDSRASLNYSAEVQREDSSFQMSLVERHLRSKSG